MDPAETLVVRSPRQTVSLLRNRRRPQFGRERERERDPAAAAAAGPKPSEVYGFVGSITTVIATAVYLVWAYTPEPCLHSLGITYYPTKYWAVAVPAFVMVAVALSLLVYVGSNFLATPPPTSFTTIFDEYSRERAPDATTEQDEEEAEAERPIEPIADISIHHINSLMFDH